MQTKSAAQVKEIAKRMPKEQLETSFLWHWAQLYPALPMPVRQHQFHPKRRWRWDFSWEFPDIKLAVEIQGGTWMKKSGHVTGSGIDKDYEKWREAIKLGWLVLPFSTSDMRHPAAVCDFVAEVLCRADEVVVSV